ncbi:DNA polymerase III subunit delta' [Methyloglobulus sp.]|uniref:DNA polymerase III subunit delta' n=1 Tax=Methyloglobulus sp. TaxID=2518622 RepID=UPI003988BF87
MTAINSVLPWQQKNWGLLHSYIKQKRIPQALLITGTGGLGKHSLAKQFAHSLLCLKPQDDGSCCGHCNSCLLVKADTHPDLIQIQPDEEKKTISINQIRTVVADTYLKPQFETHRVVIINPADVMTASAANAFLKCLEEPTERTVFILISDKPNKLPATIVSRCQKLSITFPERQILYEWLKGQGIDHNQETLLNLMRGSILKAQQLSDEGLLKQRKDCFNDWLTIANHTDHPAIISEKWQKLPETELINWLISWVTDLIKCACGINSELLSNQDLAKPLQSVSQQLELKGLYGLYDRIISSRQQLGTQINFQIMIEEILVQWQELNGRN